MIGTKAWFLDCEVSWVRTHRHGAVSLRRTKGADDSTSKNNVAALGDLESASSTNIAISELSWKMTRLRCHIRRCNSP